jgi:hypothetical protein
VRGEASLEALDNELACEVGCAASVLKVVAKRNVKEASTCIGVPFAAIGLSFHFKSWSRAASCNPALSEFRG